MLFEKHSKMVLTFFFFFFLNPIYCPSRRGLMLDFTFLYATPLAPNASSAPASLTILSVCTELTPSDRSPCGPSTETLFSDAPLGNVRRCNVGGCLEYGCWLIWRYLLRVPDRFRDRHDMSGGKRCSFFMYAVLCVFGMLRYRC